MRTVRARTMARRKPGSPETNGRESGALTSAQLQSLEAELLAEQARLERSLGTAASSERVDPLVRDGFGSGPGSDPEGGLRIALHGRAHARHETIGVALRRLADGTYGRCSGCGKFIPFGRLLVMPESERCMACGPRA